MLPLSQRSSAASGALAPAGRSEVEVRSGVVEANDPAVLGAIHRNDVVLAIWRRDLPSSIAKSLNHAAFRDWPRIRFEAAASDVRDALDAEVKPPGGTGFAPLFEDVGTLSEMFARTMGVRRVRIRLEAVDRDMCRLFHCDYVAARLITTYRGPGTEYLAPGSYDPEGLEKRDNELVVTGWDRVQSVPKYAVGVFKGCRPLNGTPRSVSRGCVHRSPPVEQRRKRRLLLCIDVETSDA